MNKRAIENLIKAGALDCLGGTRKQLMQVYPGMLRPGGLRQQGDDYRPDVPLRLHGAGGEEGVRDPRCRTWANSAARQLLFFEKEVLGIYLSGHPLEEYEALWRARITAVSADFALDEESGVSAGGR